MIFLKRFCFFYILIASVLATQSPIAIKSENLCFLNNKKQNCTGYFYYKCTHELCSTEQSVCKKVKSLQVQLKVFGVNEGKTLGLIRGYDTMIKRLRVYEILKKKIQSCNRFFAEKQL